MPEDLRQVLIAQVAQMAVSARAERPAQLLKLLPWFANPQLGVPTRVAAAARVLRLVPDRARPVRRVARSLIAGLSLSRGLERLRQLQNQIEKCEALDAFIAQREKRVKLACPRCRVRLPRIEMVKHLWNEHGLTLDHGKARTSARVIDELHERYAATGDSEWLDRVVALTGAAGLRRWLAIEDTHPDELAPLLAAAKERNAGLCPACFSELPVAVAPLPEPLVLANGRLAGDGYAVALGGNAWFETLRVTTPGTATSVGQRSLTPRALATLMSAAVLVVVLLVARSFPFALWGIVLALGAYLVVRGLRASPDRLEDRALDAAWERFVEKLADRPQTARFLTRLCRASTEWGDPEARARLLNAITRRALSKAHESDAEIQLLAAARVLQVEDLARYGRDVVAGIASAAADGFDGKLPADYAEFVVGCYLMRPRDPGDLARLRVLLVGAAFDAGLVPRDLLSIWAGAPQLALAMAVEPAHRLGLLHGLWRTRAAKRWESVAPAETVFELARTAPPTAARVLARFPDLLLFHRPEPFVEEMIGPVLVCARGVSVGGLLTADPDAEVRLGDSGHELVFGRHRVEVARPLPADLPALLTRWLRFRAEVFVPFIDGYLAAGSPEIAERVRGPFCRRCRACGTVAAVSRGAIGWAVPSGGERQDE